MMELIPAIPQDVQAALLQGGQRTVGRLAAFQPEIALLADSATDLTWEVVRGLGDQQGIELPPEIRLPDVGDDLLGAFEAESMSEVAVDESAVLPIQAYFSWLSHQDLAWTVIKNLAETGIGHKMRVMLVVDTLEYSGQGVLLTQYWLAGRAMGIDSQDLVKPLAVWADMRSTKDVGNKQLVGVALMEGRGWQPEIFPTWQEVVARRTFEATGWSRQEARGVQDYLWRLLVADDQVDIAAVARLSQEWVAQFPDWAGQNTPVNNPLEVLTSRYSHESIRSFKASVRRQIREGL